MFLKAQSVHVHIWKNAMCLWCTFLKMQGVCTACFEKAIRSLCGFQNVQRDCFAFKKTQSVHVARFEILKVNELLL